MPMKTLDSQSKKLKELINNLIVNISKSRMPFLFKKGALYAFERIKLEIKKGNNHENA